MSRVQFTHTDQTEIRQIGSSILVAFSQRRELRQMIVAIKGETDQLVFDHFEDNPGVAEMKRA